MKNLLAIVLVSIASEVSAASYFNGALQVIQDLGELGGSMLPGKHLKIVANLEKPPVATIDKFMRIEKTDNFCLEASNSEYWNRAFKATSEREIFGQVFCPNAPAQLKAVRADEILAEVKDMENLKTLMTAFMLRWVTLQGQYSSSYQDAEYAKCKQAISVLVHGQEPTWPCGDQICAAAKVNAAFDTMAQSSECKALKEQVIAYGKQVAETINGQPVAHASQAIRLNLLNFNIITDLVHSAMEANFPPAQENIAAVLETLGKVLGNFEKGQIYTAAVEAFKKKMKELGEDLPASFPPTPATPEPTKTEK